MAKYKVEYEVTQRYAAEIEIPDAIHHTKWGDYVRFHRVSLKNEEPIDGANDFHVFDHWIELAEGND